MEGRPEDIAGNIENRVRLKTSLSPEFGKVLNSDAFVDKSALILAVLWNEEDTVLCTAPRRFGKTVNLNMMQRFLELEVDENGKEKTTVLDEKDNYKLFNSAKVELKVMQNKTFVKTHFGQYPIIKINFFSAGKVKGKSDAVDVCRTAISRAFMQHEYLYTSKLSPLEDGEKTICEQWCKAISHKRIPEKNVIRGLANLAVYLNKFHKKKVFLLVDEYDSIISNALYNLEADPDKRLKELECTAKFPIQVIGDALKTFPGIFQGAYITGILDIAGILISGLLGNVLRRQFGTNNLCQDFYGFTQDEVVDLFQRCGVDEELKKKAMAKYNGYANGAKKPLYNPQSIVQFLGNLTLGEGALQNYWQQSGYIQNMYKLFLEDGVRKLLNSLLQDAIDFQFNFEPLELSDLQSLHDILIRSDLTCEVTIVVRFLVSLGYLTYSLNNGKLQIPNGELIDEFRKRLQNYFFKTYGIISDLALACSTSFSELVILCDEDDSLPKFKEQLANFQKTLTCLLQGSEIIHPLNEATLQVIFTWACSQNGFLFGNEIIIPNYVSRTDVILFNDKSGIIVELKCDSKTVEDALKQIFEKHYYNVFTTEKYFNDSQKAPPLSLVMGFHVDSENKASVLCFRKKDITDVLDDLKVEAKSSLENRIKIAVTSMGERLLNTLCEKAIRLL